MVRNRYINMIKRIKKALHLKSDVNINFTKLDDKISEEELETLKELATESPPPMTFNRKEEFIKLSNIENKETEKIVEEITNEIKKILDKYINIY